MKKILKITVLTLVYLFLCGKSCVDDTEKVLRQERAVTAAKDSIRDAFEVDYLSEESRYAAEIMAIQKVKDLADYLNIYTNSTMDSLFRVKAGEMIREVFISGDAGLSFGKIKGKKVKGMALGEFLNEGFRNDIVSADILFDSLRVLYPLKRSAQETYTGALTGYQDLVYITNTDTLLFPKEIITINISAYREEKIFGIDTLLVWAVFLGDITKVE